MGGGVQVPKPASCGLGEISPHRREIQVFLMLSGLSFICLVLLFRVHRTLTDWAKGLETILVCQDETLLRPSS